MPNDGPARVAICLNPNAGARDADSLIRELEAHLKADGFQPDTFGALDEFEENVANYALDGELLGVVAAGGDGTVTTVVNRIPIATPVAVFPLGTENLLAKQLGMTANPKMVATTIQEGHRVRIDAGEADGKMFLLMLGCGFDAEVVRRLHQTRQGHIDHFAYAKPIFESIRSYSYPELRVYCERETVDSQTNFGPIEAVINARWVFAVNLPRYAGGIRIAPQAIGNDGLLDVCTFRDGSLWNGLRYLSGVVLGQHESWSDFISLRTTQLRIESDEPVPYQIDGDPGGLLPVQVRVLPDRVTLFVPAHAAAKSELWTPM